MPAAPVEGKVLVWAFINPLKKKKRKNAGLTLETFNESLIFILITVFVFMISKILALDGNVIAENRQMLEYLRQKRSFYFISML